MSAEISSQVMHATSRLLFADPLRLALVCVSFALVIVTGGQTQSSGVLSASGENALLLDGIDDYAIAPSSIFPNASVIVSSPDELASTES
jgi:hypothetical protein